MLAIAARRRSRGDRRDASRRSTASAHDLLDPSGPPALVVATQAARAANDGAISLADARAAWETARRYSLPD